MKKADQLDYWELRREYVLERLAHRKTRRQYAEHARLLYNVKYATEKYLRALSLVNSDAVKWAHASLRLSQDQLAKFDGKRHDKFRSDLLKTAQKIQDGRTC